MLRLLSRSAMIRTPLFLFACLALGLAAFTGCRSVKLDSRGDMVAVYKFREFQMVLNTTAPSAARATEAALPQLDLFKVKGVVRTYDAEFEARARNDQKVHIRISEVNSRQTMLVIRWGESGDLKKSRALYEAIERGLGGY